MKLFEFTLKFALPKGELNSEIYVEQLATSGCDDALIGIGQPGKIVDDVGLRIAPTDNREIDPTAIIDRLS